jgi:hypothetical protein
MESFLRALLGAPSPSSAKRRPDSTSPSQTIADLWGCNLSSQLVALLDGLGAQPSSAEPNVGEFFAFATADWLPPRGNAFEFMLREPFQREALLLGAVPLGATGSGDHWLIEASPAGRVFMMDHEVSKLCPIADSIESFARLLELSESDDSSPAAWRSLEGRVAGHNDVVVHVKRSFEANDMLERWNAAKDVFATLWFGKLERLKPAPARSGREPLHPAEQIADLLRAFLHGGEIAPLDSPSRIVRDAAKSLLAKGQLAGPARLEALHTVDAG